MVGWVDGWTDGRKDGRTEGRTDGRMDPEQGALSEDFAFSWRGSCEKVNFFLISSLHALGSFRQQQKVS